MTTHLTTKVWDPPKDPLTYVTALLEIKRKKWADPGNTVEEKAYLGGVCDGLEMARLGIQMTSITVVEK